MSENHSLVDFLVWLERRHKAGKILEVTKIVVVNEILTYLKEDEEKESVGLENSACATDELLEVTKRLLAFMDKKTAEPPRPEDRGMNE